MLDDVEVVGVYALPLTERFRRTDVREGVLLRGPAGWGEFCPFPEYSDAACVPWLAGALEAATVGWPAPVRDVVPVNCIVPAVAPARAAELVRASGCATAKVKVADPGQTLADDVARVAAVRAALGAAGAVRVDANGAWSVAGAVEAVTVLDDAAGGLEYVEQPCASVEELAAVRRSVSVPVAADESIRLASDPLTVALAGAADVAVIKCLPLGGVSAALAVAEACGLPVVVSSALESSVGLAASVALAAALPSLPFACGLGTVSLFARDSVPAEASLRPLGGALSVAAPVPTAASLAAALTSDDGRRAWWTARLERVASLLDAP
ncbi:o-succinylbenzoate synthase [Spongisporangium articulatum]|uniref:o-succinylbenzoate synthase n=1 Tax=Spongisporangium articulatum TaxID=3362603 RepID=A0ABW8ASS1_9ACTN